MLIEHYFSELPLFPPMNDNARYCYAMDISKQAKTKTDAEQICIDGQTDGLAIVENNEDWTKLTGEDNIQMLQNVF